MLLSFRGARRGEGGKSGEEGAAIHLITPHAGGPDSSRSEHPQGASTRVSPLGAASRWTSKRSPTAGTAWFTWLPTAGPA